MSDSPSSRLAVQLAALAQTLGPGGLWSPNGGPGTACAESDWAPLLRDWRGRYQGQALAVARPNSTEQVAQVVRWCMAHRVGLVPQGGNTGLVGGGVPDGSGQQLLVSLQRLKQIRAIDQANASLVADAGCTLQSVQEAAAQVGMLYPLSLASEGSCTLGGTLATNAGGTQVLRYGTARELCLGLEVVTAQGEVWHGLSSLRKDNSGYDLRDLFIGSEGTLGVITAASLRLHPQPRGQATALVGCQDLSSALALLSAGRTALDAGLTAFEVMANLPLALLRQHQPQAFTPAMALTSGTDGACPPWTVLIENHSSESSEHAEQRLHDLLQLATAQGWIQQAVLAASQGQCQAMWRLREAIPLAERQEGLMVKHDIGLPTSQIPHFVAAAGQAIANRWPQAKVVCFGHLGDGNLHYNVQPPSDQQQGAALQAFELAVNAVVFDHVCALGGTISAEHGIGALRQAELARRKAPVALHMMQAIKQALDPLNIMNPGRLLPS